MPIEGSDYRELRSPGLISNTNNVIQLKRDIGFFKRVIGDLDRRLDRIEKRELFQSNRIKSMIVGDANLGFVTANEIYVPNDTSTPRVQITSGTHGGLAILGSGDTYDDETGVGTAHLVADYNADTLKVGGWTVSNTAISNSDGTVTMRSPGNLAFGATPPTNPTVGTGVFIDNTGIYGLNANTQEFYLRASDGKAVFGAGAAVLDSSGMTISDGASFNVTGNYSSGNNIAIDVNVNHNTTGSLRGLSLLMTDSGSANATTLGGIDILNYRNSTGTLSSQDGMVISLQSDDTAGTVTTATGLFVEDIRLNGATNAVLGEFFTDATATNKWGLNINVGGSGTNVIGINVAAAGGSAKTKGIQITGPDSGANNYAVYSSAGAQSVHAGNFRIGSTTAPTVALNVTGDVTVDPSTAGDAIIAHSNGSANAAAGVSYSASVPATSTTGDLRFVVTLIGTKAWSWGLDNSDSDAWVLSENASLGTSNRIKALGNLVEFLTTAKTTQYGVYIKGGTAAYGTNTDGVLLDGVYDTAGTNLAINFIHSATSGAGDAVLTLGTHPSGTGDPRVHYRISGTTSWSAGVDNSDSDSYVIAASGALGTTNRLRLTTAAPTAFVQTYSTASHTHTQTTMTNPAAYAAGTNGYSTGAMASAIHAEVIALRANMVVVQNVVNAIIDDLQALGLFG